MKRAAGFIGMCVVAALACIACKEKTATSTLADYDAALHKRIRKIIDDDEKRDKLELLHAQSKLRQLDLAMIFAESGVKMRGNPEMTREDADILLKEAAEKRAKTLRDVATIRLEMRTLVTENEWRQLYENNPATADASKKEN